MNNVLMKTIVPGNTHHCVSIFQSAALAQLPLVKRNCPAYPDYGLVYLSGCDQSGSRPFTATQVFSKAIDAVYPFGCALLALRKMLVYTFEQLRHSEVCHHCSRSNKHINTLD